MRTLFLTCLVIYTYNTLAQSSASTNGQRHAVYYEIFGPGLFFGSANYDFTYQFSAKQALRARAGLAVFDGLFAIGSINYSVGEKKHFGEIGFGSTTFHTLTGNEKADLFFRPGYRFKGSKGLLVSAGIYIQSTNGSFVEDILYFPGIGVGYVIK